MDIKPFRVVPCKRPISEGMIGGGSSNKWPGSGSASIGAGSGD